MNQKQNRAFYRHAPISRPSTLARVLEVTEPELQDIVERADSLCVHGPKFKKADGSYRYTYMALPELRRIQEHIKNKILREVNFPRYLQGGIRDPIYRRSYTRDAKTHSGARFVLTADVENFFPSITADLATSIWTNFFDFLMKSLNI